MNDFSKMLDYFTKLQKKSARDTKNAQKRGVWCGYDEGFNDAMNLVVMRINDYIIKKRLEIEEERKHDIKRD